MSQSYESGQRPLTNYEYQSTNNPYNSGAGFYGESSGFLPPQPRKKGTSNWIKFGVPIAIIVIAGAVVGGILGSRASNKDSGTKGGLSNPADPAAASNAVANKNKIGVFPTSTDSYGLPVYPTNGDDNAAYVQPTFVASASGAWPTDNFTPASPSATTPPTAQSIRSDRPRLIAPKFKWDALHDIVQNDPYMKIWNETIIGNATFFKSQPLVPYNIDGGLTLSGVLDVAREVKARMKAYAYAFRVTGDHGWVDRAWDELKNAAGNSSQPFGTAPDNWNSQHFLDLAEFTAAFAIAYDWLYDQWSAEQKSQIMWTMLNLGLNYGVQAYTNSSVTYAWWRLPENGKGNWNCVCNGGLTMGALALLGDDPTGMSEQLLANTIPNALENCAIAPTTDGSWTETANYWYFGTTAHAEMSSSLLTATGSDYGLLTADKDFNSTALYHMYITGMTSLFNYGDHGPNKFSTTANSLMFYATHFKTPAYMLFQRDQRDAQSDPWNMFWYDPTVAGAFWEGLPLDHYFNDPLDQWASMRSSWTTNEGTYIAMKAGDNNGLAHQNHNDLDVGDFVLDAMGQRWAGELGSGDYDADGYFNGNDANGPRWLYYRKRTEGQNTIVVGQQNQKFDTNCTTNFGTTGEAQDATTTYTVPDASTAWFTMDSTVAYDQVTSMKRGIRFLNKRRQVLLQDEVNTNADVQWRMHTNATVTVNGNEADLALGGKTMKVKLLSPSGATFATTDPVRYPNDPKPPAPDQENPGVTVLTINLGSGQNNIQVLFNPQWDGLSDSDFVTPPSVDIDQWSNTSHN